MCVCLAIVHVSRVGGRIKMGGKMGKGVHGTCLVSEGSIEVLTLPPEHSAVNLL